MSGHMSPVVYTFDSIPLSLFVYVKLTEMDLEFVVRELEKGFFLNKFMGNQGGLFLSSVSPSLLLEIAAIV